MAYRDDREALEGHRTELEAKLRELRAKIASNASLEAELLDTVKDLEATYARINASKPRARRELPLLQRVYIASPCSVPWESMTGDERERMCASCNKTVYDVSQMTTSEAETLLRSKGTDACLRIFRRFDGTVLTADCPVGESKKKRARRRGGIAGVLAGAAAAGAAFAMTRERDNGAQHADRSQGQRPEDGTQLPPGVPTIDPNHTPTPPNVPLEPVMAAGGISIAPQMPPPRPTPRRTQRVARPR